MRNAYIKALEELAEVNNSIVAVVADNSLGLYDDFIQKYTDRFFDFGICESNAVGIASGMASCGLTPFVYAIGAFLVYRAYEFIRNDVCLQNQNVKLVSSGCGISYNNLGPTHHTTEDIAALRVLPNLVILSPASPMEVQKVVNAAAKHVGPVYIRLGKVGEREIYKDDYNFEIGKGITLQEGSDVTIISTGSIICEVLDANQALKEKGINLNIINMPTIKPLDEKIIIQAAKKTKNIITIEEHSIYGGLGGAVAEVIAQNGVSVNLKTIGLNGFCKSYGWHQDIKKFNGISSDSIVDAVNNMLLKTIV